MTESIPMTLQGYNKIRAEVEELENVQMPLIVEKIAEARAEGDLKENAEYHGQRENQSRLQAKINMLKGKLAAANIVDMSKIDKDLVAFGASVLVKDLDYDDEETFILVGAGEDDPNTGRILITSPIGQGLLGKKVGEVAEIPVPKGTLKFEVLKIEYED